MVETRSGRRTDNQDKATQPKKPKKVAEGPNKMTRTDEEYTEDSSEENPHRADDNVGDNEAIPEKIKYPFEELHENSNEENKPEKPYKVSKSAPCRKQKEIKAPKTSSFGWRSIASILIFAGLAVLFGLYNVTRPSFQTILDKVTEYNPFSNSPPAYNKAHLDNFLLKYAAHLSPDGQRTFGLVFNKTNQKTAPVFLLLTGSNSVLLETIALDYANIFVEAQSKHNTVSFAPVTITNGFKMSHIEENYKHNGKPWTFVFHHLEHLPPSEAIVLHQYADKDHNILPKGSLSIYTLTTSKANINSVGANDYSAQLELPSALLRQLWVSIPEDTIECVINRVGELSVIVK